MKKLVLLFTVAFAMIFVSCTFCPTREDREKSAASGESNSVVVEDQSSVVNDNAQAVPSEGVENEGTQENNK